MQILAIPQNNKIYDIRQVTRHISNYNICGWQLTVTCSIISVFRISEMIHYNEKILKTYFFRQDNAGTSQHDNTKMIVFLLMD